MSLFRYPSVFLLLTLRCRSSFMRETRIFFFVCLSLSITRFHHLYLPSIFCVNSINISSSPCSKLSSSLTILSHVCSFVFLRFSSFHLRFIIHFCPLLFCLFRSFLLLFCRKKGRKNDKKITSSSYSIDFYLSYIYYLILVLLLSLSFLSFLSFVFIFLQIFSSL